ncbi:MAG: nucleoside triphosphate pyrophosphohydrolase [Actinobacteria bacterium]|nr:nucleoside triphosphate pyrophosphohydrolase [Actinomycetota bacterium]
MTLPRIVVVGLGPAGAEYVTEHTIAEIARIPNRYLRTARHPSAKLVTSAISFDEIYEAADTFDDVYDTIVDRLVGAATLHGEILYAVPGSPLVLERTVRMMMTDHRIDLVVHPAMSFLDLAYARLGVDPVEAAVTLIDGHSFAIAAAGITGPMLVAHAHADWVLSEIKLAAEGATGDEPVTILARLGTPDETITHTTWAELDRSVAADHLTCLYIPGLATPVAAETARLHQLTRLLREKCPWDQKQTHASLVRYLIEETYEVVDALQALDPNDLATDEALVEELGDLLYQIEFHAAIAEQQGRFTMADVAQGVHDKLVRRHPHVFAPEGTSLAVADDAETVKANWDEIKKVEKGRTSALDGIAQSQPALAHADAVQTRAATVGFDWPDVDGALPKIAEEVGELRVAAAAGDAAATRDELGDLLFAVVNVARHLQVEPETALRAATRKFQRRFENVEVLARERGIDMSAASLTALDELWELAKADERAGD